MSAGASTFLRAEVTASPAAVGSGNIQTVNAPTIHAQTVLFGHPTIAATQNVELPTANSSQKLLPNLRYLGAETVGLYEEFSQGLAERDLTPNALIIRFANEARPGSRNLSARVRAILIYRYGDKEKDITGSWLSEGSDTSMFDPDSRRHKLIAGMLMDGQFAVITGENIIAHRRQWYRSDAVTLKGFQEGTLLVQLIDVQSHDVLFHETFVINLNPLRIAPQSGSVNPLHPHGQPIVASETLEIVFREDRKPYLEQQPKGAMPGGILEDRRYRVGVRNKGDKAIANVRVVLEDCQPGESHGIHLEHALQFMDNPQGTSQCTVPPALEPSTFVDVIYDEILGGKLRDDAFGICYASQLKSFAIPRGTYIVTLRAEGDGNVARRRFRIFQDPTSEMLTMCAIDQAE